MTSIGLKTEELVTMATKYVADAYFPKEDHAKCKVNTLKTKELLMYHCGCHGNLVIIAMRYVPNAYHPKESSYQIWT